MKKILSFFAAILFAGSMMATDVAVTIHASSGDYYAKTHEWKNATQYDQVVLDDVISANLVGSGNNGKYYSDWRFYTEGSDAGSFSIDAIEGYALKSVTFTYTPSNSGALYMGEKKLTSKAAVELSGRKAVFQCKNTNSSTNGQVRLTAIAVTYEKSSGEEPPVETKYYMKNNWNAGSEWTWKEMSKSVTGAGLYVLEKAVFGGTGVNYNTAETDEGAEWVPLSDIKGDAIAAKDTVTFVLNPTEKSVTANLVGKYQEGGEPPVVTLSAMVKGLNGNWDGDEMAVAADQKTASVVIKLAEGEHQFKMFINGEWRSNAYKYHRGFTSAESITGNESDNMILTADVAGEYGFTWTFESNKLEITFPAAPADPNQMYIWDGSGVTTAEAAIELGGKAEAIEAENKSNIVIGSAQKGNWCWKVNKGFASGANYVGIALDNAVNAGDTVKVAHFRTGDKDCFIGMDFSADKASVSTAYQIISTENPQILSSNGIPADADFIVPEGVKDAKYIRVYRNSGSTGLWIAHFEIVKNQGGSVEPPVETPKFYITGNAALVGDELAWHPDAIPSMADEYVFKGLTAAEYQLKITENGQWESAKGYDDLEVVPAGVTTDNDRNINFKLAKEQSDLKVSYVGGKINIEGDFDVPEPPVNDKYYLKNNWGAGSEWTWKEMSKSVTAAGLFVLEDAIYGGTGVNFNTEEKDETATWVPEDQFVIAQELKLEPKDTANFLLNPKPAEGEAYISVVNIRKFQGGEPPVGTPLYYITGESLVGSWAPDALPVYQSLYEFESVKAGSYSFKITVDGTWNTAKGYDDLTLKQDGLSKDKDGNICFTLAEDGPVAVVYNEREFMVRGNFVVSEPPVGCNWDDIEWFNVGLGEGDENFNQFKICKQGELPNVVNIQTAPWADNNKGIYINFPSAEFTTISLPEGQYKVDGAGILLFLSAFSAQETEVKIEYKGEPVVFTVYNAKVDIPEVKYYMKNNWDAGSEWTWKEMTKMEGADGIYRLEQVIFGGTGVNYNTKADDEGAAWVELKDIVVPEGMELAAKDTADFQLEIAEPAPVVRALGIRKFQGGEPPIGTPLYYITGESLVGSWEPNALPVYQSMYEFESVKAGSYSFKITVDGTWNTAKGYDDLTLKQDGLSKDNDGNICFTLAEDGPVAVLYTDEEFMVRGNFVVPEPPVSEWDEIIFKETDIADKGQTAKSFVSDTNEKFVLSVTDDDSKIAIDANSARFGTPVLYSMYRHRLKTGGKSSAKNALSLAIPADGQLRIAVRTGSNSATDRTLVLKQNDVELFNSVIQESDAEAVDEDGTEVNVYPYVTVNVKAGNVAVEYPVNGLNFYEFGFKAGGSEPPVVEHTYTVAGNSEAAFGTAWDPKNEANDMTLTDDGVYVWEKEGIELLAGSVDFKVCEDHDWKVAYPSADYKLAIAEDGIYTIVINFDPVSHEVSAKATKTGSAVIIPTIAMHGNFLGSWADTRNFELAADQLTASLKLTIAKGNYEFGMRIGGSGNWTANGAAFERAANKHMIEAGQGNLKLAADAEGEYTFIWTFADKTLEIIYPEAGPVEDPTVAVIGSMTQWQEAIPFTLSEDKKSAKLVVDKIPVGDYEFKMLINGQYRSNGYEFHRDFHACAGISGNVEANMVLKVDAMGEFTFEWFFENDSLNIIFPEKSEIPDLYIKNNWGGAEEWSWKKMTYEVVEGNSVYYIMDVVFGGSGVNLNGKPSDEDASWIPVDRIQAFTPAQTKTELQALDTVMFVYYPAFETLVAVVTGPYNAPACEFEDGLYLVGSMNNWQKSKEYMLQINQSADGEEFMVELTLHTGDEFKVLWWAGCQEIAWIPGGTQNIIVDAAHAGLVRIYVRPAGNEAWPDKYWYYEVVIPENINNAEVNTKVVKMIENGQLFIQKGGKTYNVIGTLVK